MSRVCSSLFWVGILPLALMACTGSGETDTVENPFAHCDGTKDWVDTAPLRRLTETELRNALRDLLVTEELVTLDASGEPELPTFQLPMAVSNDGYTNDHDAMSLNSASIEVQVIHQVASNVAVQVYEAARVQDEGIQNSEQEMKKLVRRVLPRAFRRDISTETLALWEAHAVGLKGGAYPEAKAKLVMDILQAPQFLYRLEEASEGGDGAAVQQVDDWSIASRLSFLLWSAPPDDALRQAARDGVLSDPGVRASHVQRMLKDPKSETPIREFMDQWMGSVNVGTLPQDMSLYPEFDEMVWEEMKEETRRFAVDVMLRRGESYDGLLLSNQTQVTPALAKLYDVKTDADEGWSEVSLEPTERSGLLTQGTFLASHAGPTHPSPILRSIAIMERLLCCVPKTQPDNVTPIGEESAYDGPTTNRERVEDTTSVAGCANCHQAINPTGFATENYDALGRYRTRDNGLPVDATGGVINLHSVCKNPVYMDADGDATGAVELSQQIAGSDAFGSCFVKNYTRFAVGHHLDATDTCHSNAIYHSTDTTGRTLESVLVEMVKHQGFIQRKWE